MVRKFIEWAVNNPLIVLLFTLGLVVGGGYAFFHVNVEAYPDPAPPIYVNPVRWASCPRMNERNVWRCGTRSVPCSIAAKRPNDAPRGMRRPEDRWYRFCSPC